MGLADFWDDSEESDDGRENAAVLPALNVVPDAADNEPSDEALQGMDPQMASKEGQSDEEPVENAQQEDTGSQWRFVRDLCMEQLVDIDAASFASWPLDVRERFILRE